METYTISELSEILNVSERTIIRQFQAFFDKYKNLYSKGVEIPFELAQLVFNRQIPTKNISSDSEEDTLTMEEDIFITALLGRSPKFTDTLYLSIKDFVLDKMPLKAKLAYFSKNLTEALTSYTEVLSEKIELCEGVVEVIKENKMSFPYVMEELIKEMSNYIEVLKNGRKF